MRIRFRKRRPRPAPQLQPSDLRALELASADRGYAEFLANPPILEEITAEGLWVF